MTTRYFNSRKCILFFFIIFFSTLLLTNALQAPLSSSEKISEDNRFTTLDQVTIWTPNGTAICNAGNDQAGVSVISDGMGGAFIVWGDDRGVTFDIYAQRVNLTGHAQWAANGVQICIASNNQQTPKIISDGAGGAIIAWRDYRSANWDIYAQRINSTGHTQWTGTGVAICTAGFTQWAIEMVSDGGGGAILAWEDQRSNVDYDIYAQRINSTGHTQWISNGVAICTEINDQARLALTSDSAGGAIITWDDDRDVATDIYAQKIDSNGNIQWDANGTAICIADQVQLYPTICGDNAGGAIITWHDDRIGVTDIYANHIDSTGSTLWGMNGSLICNASGLQYYPEIIPDGLGGYIITWQDYRFGSHDIFAQKINATGGGQWGLNGRAINTQPLDQVFPKLVSDGAGGAVITWQSWNGANYDVYAQKVNASAWLKWDTNGTLLCNEINNQQNVVICEDGFGGAIVAWDDDRNGIANTDIYSQRVYSLDAVLEVTTNATAYIPGEIMQVRTQFYFNNGTLIDGGIIGFFFQGPNHELLGSKANVTDSNGISTETFSIEPDYLDGTYTIYITGVKGSFNVSKNITIDVVATNFNAWTDAPVYLPAQTMQVRANYTFSNGTAIDGAVVAFLFRGPDLSVLGSKANFTDANGLTGQNFLIGSDYLNGIYTIYVTAIKGNYSANATIPIYVNATYIDITIDEPILIGDIFPVYIYFGFTNGTPIDNAVCGFSLRNESGPLQNRANFTDSAGISSQLFGTTNYGEGYYEMYITATKGNYSLVANKTFFITEYDGPIILTPTLSPDPPAYNQSGLVNVSLGVSPGYATITGASLFYSDGGSWNFLSMTNSTPVDYRGFAYYNASIPPLDWNTNVSYYITAIDSLGNSSVNDNSGQYFNYTVIDLTAPFIYDPTWTSPIAYNTTVNVTVRVAEDPASPTVPSGVNGVLLIYNGDFDNDILPMIRINGTTRDGYYSALIPPQPYASGMDFYIIATDVEGNLGTNNNNSNYFSYIYGDFWGPTISNIVLNNAPIAFNMTANVTCRVQEDQAPTPASGIDTVILFYHDGLSWNNITMSWISGTPSFDGIYQGIIPTIQYGFLVPYYIWCNDSAGNINFDDNGGLYYSYTVDDFTPPIIESIVVANAPISYDIQANVTTRLTEWSIPTVQSGIDTAILIYRAGGGSWNNVSMTRYSGNAADGWYSALIPAFDYNTLVEYWIWCNDSAGNPSYDDNSGSYYFYLVNDFTGPTFPAITIQNAPVAYTMQANITVRVQEDTIPTNASGVHTVLLSYNDGGGWVNLSMNSLSGDLFDGIYQANIPVRAYGTNIDFWVWANDTAGNPNWDDNTGAYYSYTVDDFWGPTISAITLRNPPIYYNKTANVTCRVQEPTVPTNAAGVQSVILIYHNGVTWNNLTMTRYSGNQYDGYYTVLIPEMNYGTFVRYWIWCNDSAGNPSFDNNGGSYYSYTPIDIWSPTISGISIVNAPIAYNMTANVTCRVQEPTVPANAAGVDNVILYYSFGAGWFNVSMSRYSGNPYDGYYSALIPARAYGSNVRYWIWCNDTASNPNFDDNYGGYYLYVVDDFWGPSISEITLQNAPIAYNMTANITCRVIEPTIPANAAGVQTVTLYYQVDGVGWSSTGMTRYIGNQYDGYYSASIPANDYGSLIEYYIWCNDLEGNTNVDDNSSNYYSYIVDDFWAPTISGVSVANAPIAYNMTANVTVQVQEPTVPAMAANVSTIILSYNAGAGWNNVSMSLISGDVFDGLYSGFVPIQIYANTVQYMIYCNDSAGNPSSDDNSGLYYSYVVDDFWGPTIVAPVQNDTIIEYTEAVRVDVQITEPTTASGVQAPSVILSYWAGVSWTNLSMTLTGGDNFDGTYSATIPKQPYGIEVAYKVFANDIADNPSLNDNSTSLFNYTVTDLTAPTVALINPANETTIAGVTQLEIADIAASDTDVNNITVIYRYNSSSWTVHGSYLSGTNLTWNVGAISTILVNISSWVASSNYTIYILAQDLRGLVSSPSYIYNITVSNYTGPLLYNIFHTPDPVGYNESSVVSCTILVPSVKGDVDTVLLNYSAGAGWTAVTMVNTTPRITGAPINFAGTIPEFALGTVVSYAIFANDTYSNMTYADNYGVYYTYTVSDKWGPLISDITVTNAPITYYDIPNVECRIREPAGAIGVDTAILVYDIGSGWVIQLMNRYVGSNFDGWYDADIPQTSYGTLVRFYISVNDSAGNERIDNNGGAYYSFTVTDLWGPTITETTITNWPVAYNETGDITCRVNETASGAGVATVLLYFNNVTGWFSVPMTRYSGNAIDGYYSGSIPNHTAGTTIQLYIWANDTAGNVGIDDNASNYYTYVVVDFLPPSIVTNLIVTVYYGAHAINISWSPNMDADFSHYQIHRQNVTDVGFIPISSNNIANTTDIFYLDTGLTDGLAFFYIVVAVDYSGLTSGPSIIVNGIPDSTFSRGELVQLHGNVQTFLNFADVNMTLDFISTNDFNMTVEMVNNTASYPFPDHIALNTFFINISLEGNPGTVQVTITITIPAPSLGGVEVDPSSYAIFYWDGDSWEELPTVYNATTHIFTATTNHFSILGAFVAIAPIGEPFPWWIIIIIIGAVAGIAIVVVATRRKKEVPTSQIIEAIKRQGHVKIQDIAREFNVDNTKIIDIILSALSQKELRGFIANKKKEFFTMDKLKEELSKILEGG